MIKTSDRVRIINIEIMKKIKINQNIILLYYSSNLRCLKIIKFEIRKPRKQIIEFNYLYLEVTNLQ